MRKAPGPDVSRLTQKDKALALLFSQWQPKAEVEKIALADAEGRILAEDQFAVYNLPVVRASSMDGIAVHGALFADGVPDTSGWHFGTDFIRADTGDDFDDAFDAVIPIEAVTLTPEGGVRIDPDTQVFPGSNIVPQGGHLKQGTLIAAKGRRLSILDMTALAAGGITEIPVLRRPRVGFIPTGSELVPVGSELKRGQNFDTNSMLAENLLRKMGAEPVMHPIVRDDKAALEAAFAEMLPLCDILLVNAGTSKGGEDYCTALLEKQGHLLFHGVAAVPGRPMSMAVAEGKAIVNLSGPTFAAFYSLDWAVSAMVARFLGTAVPVRETIEAKLTRPFRTPPVLSAMISFKVERDENGEYLATPMGGRGPERPNIAASLTAEAVHISYVGEQPYEAGDRITLELLRNRSDI